jgi:hypothetical protein
LIRPTVHGVLRCDTGLARIGNHASLDGDNIPVKGVLFPKLGTLVIELQRSAVLNALIQRRHGTAHHARPQPEPAVAANKLHVHARARLERPWRFDQHAARADVVQDDRHARAKHGPHVCDGRLANARIDTTFDYRLIHVRVCG